MCQVETSENLEGIFPAGLIDRGKKPCKKFSRAKQVSEICMHAVSEASGSIHYGIGMFCLTPGEQKIDWVPEKD